MTAPYRPVRTESPAGSFLQNLLGGAQSMYGMRQDWADQTQRRQTEQDRMTLLKAQQMRADVAQSLQDELVHAQIQNYRSLEEDRLHPNPTLEPWRAQGYPDFETWRQDQIRMHESGSGSANTPEERDIRHADVRRKGSIAFNYRQMVKPGKSEYGFPLPLTPAEVATNDSLTKVIGDSTSVLGQPVGTLPESFFASKEPAPARPPAGPSALERGAGEALGSMVPMQPPDQAPGWATRQQAPPAPSGKQVISQDQRDWLKQIKGMSDAQIDSLYIVR